MVLLHAGYQVLDVGVVLRFVALKLLHLRLQVAHVLYDFLRSVLTHVNDLLPDLPEHFLLRGRVENRVALVHRERLVVADLAKVDEVVHAEEMVGPVVGALVHLLYDLEARVLADLRDLREADKLILLLRPPGHAERADAGLALAVVKGIEAIRREGAVAARAEEILVRVEAVEVVDFAQIERLPAERAQLQLAAAVAADRVTAFHVDHALVRRFEAVLANHAVDLIVGYVLH